MVHVCPNCHIGHLHEARAPYVQLYNATLIHMPNVAAWKCDVCGETYFDTQTIRQLEVLIGDSGPPPNQHTPSKPASAGESEIDSAFPADDVLRPHSD